MTARKRTRRKDARPDEIITSALQVFAEKGYSGTSLGDIADRAQISRTTIYLYFEDKEAIIRQAFKERVAAVFEAGRQQVGTGNAPFAEVFRNVLTLLYGRMSDPNTLVILKIMISEGNKMPDLVAYYHDNILSIAERMMEELIERGIRSGDLREDARSFDPKLVISPIIVSAVWRLTFHDIAPIDMPSFIEGHLDLVLNGLSAT